MILLLYNLNKSVNFPWRERIEQKKKKITNIWNANDINTYTHRFKSLIYRYVIIVCLISQLPNESFWIIKI